MATSATRLTRDDLFGLFCRPPGVQERIAMEVELAALDEKTGKSIAYAGDRGLQTLFGLLEQDGLGAPQLHGDCVIGLNLPDGAKISLEPGGAVEFASAPCAALDELVPTVNQMLRTLARIASRLGIALVPGGIAPFDSPEEVHWMPKPYVQIFRDHFSSLGPASFGGGLMMGLSLSNQITLDYTCATDLFSKFRAGHLLTPIAVALFANSPIEAGKLTGHLSRRFYYWLNADRSRCGCIPSVLAGQCSLDDFVDWALALPIVYRVSNGRYLPGRVSFDAAMRHGFEDGAWPSLADWRSHLSQIFIDVRVRDTLELRAADGVPFEHTCAVAAFWTGLLYHAPARDAICALLQGVSAAEYERACGDAAVAGLAAEYASRPIVSLAADVIALAREGLKARIHAGLEAPGALDYLQPIANVIATRETFAERCVQLWNDSLSQSPPRYVDYFRIAD